MKNNLVSFLVVVSLTLASCVGTTKSVEDGIAPSDAYAMGVRLAVDGNYEKSGAMFEHAAKRGFLPAQWDYAIFLNSMSPKEFQNPVEAYAWFSVVKHRDSQTYKFAEKHIQRLEKSFSDSQLNESKTLAQQYIRLYAK